jgi:PST family polysaccharide transporter
MLAFGGHLTGFNLLNYLTRNGDNILIGRFLGSAPLGIYAKAYGLLMFPVQQINAPLNGVVLPALSRLQGKPDEFRRYFLRAVEVLAFIGMPIIIFSFADARVLVLAVLGPKWLGAVEIFRLLAPAALVGTVNVAPVWIFTSLGRTDRQFLWGAVSTPIILAGFLVGLRWGAAGVAASFSITFGISFLLLVFDACRHSPVRLRNLAAVLLLPFCMSALAAGTTIAIGLSAHFSAVPGFVCDAALFAATYTALALVFPNGRGMLRSIFAGPGFAWQRPLFAKATLAPRDPDAK